MISLIIPPQPPGICKQPEHDSANRLLLIEKFVIRPAAVVQIPYFSPKSFYAKMITTATVPTGGIYKQKLLFLPCEEIILFRFAGVRLQL